MKNNDFIFDFVGGLSYLSHKTSLNCDKSYIVFSQLDDKQKVIIKPFDKFSNKFFHYAATVTLNYKKLKIFSKNIKNWAFYR